MSQELVQLGSSPVFVSPLGTGTWAWGDRMWWGYGQGSYSDNDLKEAFEASVAAGVTFFDTAELYGRGRSERLLGEFAQNSAVPVIIASKLYPYPWRLWKKQLMGALHASLRRLGRESIDLYQIHWPSPLVSVANWASVLAEAVETGLVRTVGVSNYQATQLEQIYQALASRGVPLASNQVSYSLLDRSIERNGIMEACRRLGVTIIAYSPLAMGMLTGKYASQAPPPGLRGYRYRRKRLEQVAPLIALLKEIGAAHSGKTAAQVALNWTMSKETIPIPGAKNRQQALENVGALGWYLREDEIAALDRASERLS